MIGCGEIFCSKSVFFSANLQIFRDFSPLDWQKKTLLIGSELFQECFEMSTTTTATAKPTSTTTAPSAVMNKLFYLDGDNGTISVNATRAVTLGNS